MSSGSNTDEPPSPDGVFRAVHTAVDDARVSLLRPARQRRPLRPEPQPLDGCLDTDEPEEGGRWLLVPPPY